MVYNAVVLSVVLIGTQLLQSDGVKFIAFMIIWYILFHYFLGVYQTCVS